MRLYSPHWTTGRAARVAYQLSVCNPNLWFDICLTGEGAIVIVAGADPRDYGLNRYTTFYRGERV